MALQGKRKPKEITWLKTEHQLHEKPTLMDGDTPFFFNGAQITTVQGYYRVLKGLWTYEQYSAYNYEYLVQAKKDGFTIINFALIWKFIETEENYYDWSMVDPLIHAAGKANMPIEWVMWGVNFCSMSGAVPDWAMTKYDKVVNAEGLEHTRYHHDYEWDPWEYKEPIKQLDFADQRLQKQVAKFLKSLMNRTAQIIKECGYQNIVKGIQVENEPAYCGTGDRNNSFFGRSYSPSANALWEQEGWVEEHAFCREIAWRFYNAISKAVKESDYPVWTRVNYAPYFLGVRSITENECHRAYDETYLDFLGFDAYPLTTKDAIYHHAKNPYYTQGKNFNMIMEHAGGDSNTMEYIFNALAGGAVYNIWQYNNMNPWRTQFIYQIDENSGEQTLTWDAAKLFKFNNMLLKNKVALATLKPESPYLHFSNRHFKQKFEDSFVMHEGVQVTLESSNGAAMIASYQKEDNTIVVLSTAEATISAESLSKAWVGYVHDEKFKKEGERTVTNCTVTMYPFECVLIEM